MHDVILMRWTECRRDIGSNDLGAEPMKGLRILGDRRAELMTLPQPEPRRGWVVLRSRMSAVCGSDLHIYRQSADRVGDRSNRVAGHEAVGVVEEVGPGVEDLAPGTRVVVFQHYGCGRCNYCRTGEPMFCPDRRTLGNHVEGADAEFVAAPASICLPLPDSLSDEVAALLACNFGTAFSGIRKLKLDGGDVVVVFGLGPVGCCAVVVAASDGAEVVAVDPVKSRRDLAERLGAARTVDPTASDTATTIREITQGRERRHPLTAQETPGRSRTRSPCCGPRARCWCWPPPLRGPSIPANCGAKA